MSGVSKTIPVFHPTMEEFTSGFSNYITTIQPLCTEYGLAKIVPPPEWNPRKDGWFESSIRRTVIPAPIYQYVSGMKGIFQQTNIVDKPMKINDFRHLAEEHLEARMPAMSDEEIERRFWKNIRFEPPVYGADMKGSLFPPELYHWNVARLTEQNLLQHLNTNVDGVNSSYLYFGMWKAMFSWHTEDMDLFSINYLHYGEPKRWYVIPEAERHRFEQLAHGEFTELYGQCKEFLRHKTTLISPSIIRSAGITLYTGVQREGEFMITFPGAYHAGFNHGFNCAESVNFALESWISRGLKAGVCQCKPDSVRINMDIFLQNYQQNQGQEPGKVELKIPTFILQDDLPSPLPIQPLEFGGSSARLAARAGAASGPRKTIVKPATKAKRKKPKMERFEKLSNKSQEDQYCSLVPFSMCEFDQSTLF